MSANPKTLEYIKLGVEKLWSRGSFRNGQTFRPTQGDAVAAYHEFLNSSDISPELKMKGFFEIPTGVGKTAMFLAILDEANYIAKEQNDSLRTMIVVPTITILQQIEDEVREWAPDLLDDLGHYGGKHRNHENALTIITYNSWVKLMEEGKIDSTNIDILISDEAHRGTSERRLANQFNAFAQGTVQLAFTATARFDAEKSVEQSHGHQIFSRGVGEAIRLGELAAYIQTQLYVIRVQPLPPQDVFNDAAEEDADYEAARREGMKQEAWMRQMVAVLRDGRDEHTGDPLTDNKSGFYVFGTEMAERFADLASADPALQQRARDKGCKDVVVAIHSKMPTQEQNRRMKAFLRGDYLGVSSDSQLKEGFNDKELKNVFDYPRSSLVDKAQIIGRAARQWWNPVKERNEGATIIDTIVYMGSNDADEDKRIRDYSLRNAVMAWSVLEGTAVFTPKEERPEGTGYEGGGGGRVSPVLGLDVTSHLTLEELQAVYAEQERLNQVDPNIITITDDMHNLLICERNRTNVKSRAIAKKVGDSSGKLHHLIESWIIKRARTASIENWKIVMDAYKKLPSVSSGKVLNEYVDITEEKLSLLISERERTGLGTIALYKICPELSETLKISKVQAVIVGRASKIPEYQWNALVAAYKAIPSKEYNPNKPKGWVLSSRTPT